MKLAEGDTIVTFMLKDRLREVTNSKHLQNVVLVRIYLTGVKYSYLYPII